MAGTSKISKQHKKRLSTYHIAPHTSYQNEAEIIITPLSLFINKTYSILHKVIS